MPKYLPSDDGKLIDGKIVVFLKPRGGQTEAAKPSRAERVALAKTQAASLRTAAANGVPFCAECERARRMVAAQGGRRS